MARQLEHTPGPEFDTPGWWLGGGSLMLLAKSCCLESRHSCWHYLDMYFGQVSSINKNRYKMHNCLDGSEQHKGGQYNIRLWCYGVCCIIVYSDLWWVSVRGWSYVCYKVVLLMCSLPMCILCKFWHLVVIAMDVFWNWSMFFVLIHTMQSLATRLNGLVIFLISLPLPYDLPWPHKSLMMYTSDCKKGAFSFKKLRKL